MRVISNGVYKMRLADHICEQEGDPKIDDGSYDSEHEYNSDIFSKIFFFEVITSRKNHGW